MSSGGILPGLLGRIPEVFRRPYNIEGFFHPRSKKVTRRPLGATSLACGTHRPIGMRMSPRECDPWADPCVDSHELDSLPHLWRAPNSLSRRPAPNSTGVRCSSLRVSRSLRHENSAPATLSPSTPTCPRRDSPWHPRIRHCFLSPQMKAIESTRAPNRSGCFRRRGTTTALPRSSGNDALSSAEAPSHQTLPTLSKAEQLNRADLEKKDCGNDGPDLLDLLAGEFAPERIHEPAKSLERLAAALRNAPFSRSRFLIRAP